MAAPTPLRCDRSALRAAGSAWRCARLTTLLGACVLSPLWSLDELQREIARHDAEVAKAQTQFDDAVTVINDKTLKTLVRLAQRQAKAGEMVQAGATWKEVLRLQRTQPEGRAFFTAQGTLDAVLADLDQPRDLLGNPVEADIGRPVLLFAADGALLPTPETVLTSGFTARTTEMVVGRVTGDGLLFEEGGPGNGQAIGLTGSDVIYVVRADAKAVAIKAPFDRKPAWTHIAVQYSAGEMRLWLNGKLAAKGSSGFTSIPAHGDGGLGKGSGPNPGEWTEGCQFALAAFRLSSSARYSDAVTPDGGMAADKATLLAVTPEAIIAELPPGTPAKQVTKTAATKVGASPPDATVWAVSGTVDIIR